MKQNYFKFIESLQDEGKTYFTVEYGSGNQNTSLEPSADEFDVFYDLKDAEIEFEKMVNVIRDKNKYVAIEKYSKDNNYIAETIKIYYTTLVNYYQLDKGWIERDGGHSSYGIPNEEKFATKEEALKELFNRTIEKNDYIELNYFEDDEYEDTIITFYGPEAKKIIANDLYNNNAIALAIKEARIKNTLTQKELAEKMEVDIRTIQKWEAGDRTPDAKNILKLIKLLELNQEEVEELL